MILFALAAALTAQTNICHQVLDGDRILGRHVALADSQWAGVPPDAVLGFAPSPGVKRVIQPERLVPLLPAGAPIPQAPTPVCLEWPMRSLSEEEVVGAIRETFGIPELRVEVLDLSKAPIPGGRIRFNRRGITSEPTMATTGATWPGEVVAGEKRIASVWARVRIHYECEQDVAAGDLRAGQVLQPGDLRREMVRGLPPSSVYSTERLTGMTLLRPVRSGQPFTSADLRAPIAVAKGDVLNVTVRRGAILFRLDGIAEGPARLGDWVQVKNPESGKSFRALVSAPGQVQVP